MLSGAHEYHVISHNLISVGAGMVVYVVYLYSHNHTQFIRACMFTSYGDACRFCIVTSSLSNSLFRYSMVIEGGVVTRLNVESDGTGLTCSLANELLGQL